MKKIGLLAGSLRQGSYSKQIAGALAALLPAEWEAELMDISDLPLYNQDFDAEGATPESYVSFRQKVLEKDGILFVTPEYNRGLPAVLKNALDVGSRPFGKSVWNGKPAGIVSVTPGALGGFGANHQLRQTLTFLNMPVVQQPEMYLAKVDTLLTPEGEIKEEKTKQFLLSFIAAFAALVEKRGA